MSGRVAAYLRQNVLGLVAIFLALSAGAYAVQKAPKNSVVSKSIKDGQVKGPDVGAGAVTADKLGFDPATQTELDATASSSAAALSALAAPGTINQAGNPVDWTKLKGVPEGFADGVDRISGFFNSHTDNANTAPSVQDLSVLAINTTSPLAVSDLTGGVSGQMVTLLDTAGGGNVTITDAAPFSLSANWTSTDGDTLTLVRAFGSLWVEVARSVN